MRKEESEDDVEYLVVNLDDERPYHYRTEISGDTLLGVAALSTAVVLGYLLARVAGGDGR